MADDKLWEAINDIKDDTSKTRETVARVEERIAAHMSDPVIHTRPPCEHYKVLSKRLWGIVAVVISSLIASIYNLIGKN